ncbi:MAG: hypothetical protein Q8Q09_24875 [Deltaproteobacteria bacterium]|nr:hypothetical protein [Deltaproteobacteria bacterium]
MTRITSSPSSMSAYASSDFALDDPQMAAELAMIDSARSTRQAARTERKLAEAEQHHEEEAAITEQRSASVARLASGLVGAVATLAQGATSLASSTVQLSSERTKALLARHEDRQAVSNDHTLSDSERTTRLASMAPAMTPHELHDARMHVAQNMATAARLDAGATLGRGVAEGLSTAGRFVADSHDTASQETNSRARRAGSRAQDAQSLEQQSGEDASRMLGRAEEIARSMRASEDQRIANIRG